MNDFTFENQGAYNYLVYEIGKDETVDTMTLGMITNNKIAGLSQALYTQMDNKKFVKYNISSKVSVSQFFEGTVNKKRLLGVFSSIATAMLSAEDYMIDSNSLVLDLNYIYADVTTCDAVLICLPVMDTGKQPNDLSTFFKNIVFSTQFDQAENCEYVARIINYLNSTPSFSIVDFKNFLDELTNNAANRAVNAMPAQQSAKVVPAISQQVAKQTIPPQQVAPPKAPVPKQPLSAPPVIQKEKKNKFSLFGNKKKEKKKKPTPAPTIAVPGMPTPPSPAGKPIAVVPQLAAPKKQQPAPAPMVSPRLVQQPVTQPPYMQPQADFGETTVLGGGASAGETTVLRTAQPSEVTPYLIRCKNNEKIALNKPVFRVGKEKSYVDYFIGDNTAISRSHANIITREGEYFIVDTNSTNHTYINGAIIQSNIEFKLESGARIRLANENFEFKTY